MLDVGADFLSHAPLWIPNSLPVCKYKGVTSEMGTYILWGMARGSRYLTQCWATNMKDLQLCFLRHCTEFLPQSRKPYSIVARIQLMGSEAGRCDSRTTHGIEQPNHKYVHRSVLLWFEKGKSVLSNLMTHTSLRSNYVEFENEFCFGQCYQVVGSN